MRFKSKIIYFLVFFVLFTFIPLSANAKIYEPKSALSESTPGDISQFGDVPSLAGRVIGVGLSLVGVVFFILVVYGGVLYMTSHGNEEQAARGRNTIIAASIGAILVLASYSLVSFVFEAMGPIQSGGTTSCQTADDCREREVCQEGACVSQCQNQYNNRSCQDYNNCGYNSRSECQNASDCTLNICPGEDNIVCC